MMFRHIFKASFITIFLMFISFFISSASAAGRLNFMFINQTPVNITEIKIYPTYFPEYVSGNLLNTILEPQTRIYIGPDFYSDQKLWSIHVVWENGYERSYDYLRLTRYNTYMAYIDYRGYDRMVQTYVRAFARPTMYANSTITGGTYAVNVGVPEKINTADEGPWSNSKVTASLNSNQNIGVTHKRSGGGTRDLVFDDEDEESNEENVTSVKATVELTRDGKTESVLPSAEFKSGDKVKLVFTTNKDGHIYWLSKGTSGKYSVLYPSSKAGMDNAVTANTKYTFPQKGSWKFDNNKGTETVLCVLAKSKIADLDKAVELAQNNQSDASSDLVKNIVSQHEKKRTSSTRDLVFDEEDDGDINTQTQKSEGDQPFVAIYELYHG